MVGSRDNTFNSKKRIKSKAKHTHYIIHNNIPKIKAILMTFYFYHSDYLHIHANSGQFSKILLKINLDCLFQR